MESFSRLPHYTAVRSYASHQPNSQVTNLPYIYSNSYPAVQQFKPARHISRLKPSLKHLPTQSIASAESKDIRHKSQSSCEGYQANAPRPKPKQTAAYKSVNEMAQLKSPYKKSSTY
jgi:hypothetical protein